MPPPTRLTGLHHITLVTRDMDQMLRFLTDIVGLGLVLDDINQDAPEQKHYFFGDEKGSPGRLVTFFEIPDLDDNRLGAGGMHHITLGVEEEDDLRAQIAVLDEKGIGHSGIVDRGKWKAFYFKGPEGLLFELATRGPDIGAGAAS